MCCCFLFFSYLPVNLKRLIWNAQKRFRVEGANSSAFRSALSPTLVIKQLRDMCDRLVVIRGHDALSSEAQNNATLLFKTMLRATFAAKRVIKDYNLSKDAFQWLLGEVEARFNQALAHPGEMIGSIAAQSIGEPATQMTLNVRFSQHWPPFLCSNLLFCSYCGSCAHSLLLPSNCFCVFRRSTTPVCLLRT
jgi:hypothetical protein